MNCFAADCERKNAVFKLTLSTLSQSSSEKSRLSQRFIRPALLTRISTLPKRLTVWAIMPSATEEELKSAIML